jgi:hypothetical protein
MTFLFPFPDDAAETMFRVLGHLDDAQIGQLDWGLPMINVVEVRDEVAAIYLRMAYPDRLRGDDGEEVLGANEVVVSQSNRAECESMLRDECPGEHRWFKIARVTFETQEAHEVFLAAYEMVLDGSEPCADTPPISPGSTSPR